MKQQITISMSKGIICIFEKMDVVPYIIINQLIKCYGINKYYLSNKSYLVTKILGNMSIYFHSRNLIGSIYFYCLSQFQKYFSDCGPEKYTW